MRSDKDVTLVIPTILGREAMLKELIASVGEQTERFAAVIIVLDVDRRGAAAARNEGLDQVSTEWVTFMDDDDLMKSFHLAAMQTYANQVRGYDLYYPGYEVVGGPDLGRVKYKNKLVPPFGVPFRGEQRDYLMSDFPDAMNFIHSVVMVKADMLRKVGGFQNMATYPDGIPFEDWGAWRALLGAGARFYHIPIRTWKWRIHDANISGRGNADYEHTQIGDGQKHWYQIVQEYDAKERVGEGVAINEQTVK